MCAVLIGHTISTVEDVENGSVTSSVWMKVYSTGLPKLLRGLLAVVLKWENDILQIIQLQLRFYSILVILYSDLDEMPSVC